MEYIYWNSIKTKQTKQNKHKTNKNIQKPLNKTLTQAQILT